MLRKDAKCYKIDHNKFDSEKDASLKEEYLVDLCSRFELVLYEPKRIIYFFGCSTKLSKLEYKFLNTLIKHKGKRIKVNKLIEQIIHNCKEDEMLKRAHDIKNRIKKKLKKSSPIIIIPSDTVDWSTVGNHINEVRAELKSKEKSSYTNTDKTIECSMVINDTPVLQVAYENKTFKFNFEEQFDRLIHIDKEKYVNSKIKLYRYID